MIRDNTRWLEGDTPPSITPTPLSPKERIAKQRLEQMAQSDRDWAYIQANEARYAAQRSETLIRRSAAQVLSESIGLQCSLEEEMAKKSSTCAYY